MKSSKKKKKERSVGAKIALGILKFLTLVVETALLLALALGCTVYVVLYGPSTSARDAFVRFCRESSALDYVPNYYGFSEDDIQAILGSGKEAVYVETDTSLVTIASAGEQPAVDPDTGADAWGLVDEDGDGIIVKPVKGPGYSGYMMVVLDPSRVVLACDPSLFGSAGNSVQGFVERFDAVAGINAGGFEDPNGSGNGSTPNGVVLYRGNFYYDTKGNLNGFVGFDDNYIMHTGNMSNADIKAANIQYGVSFGPALVINGVKNDDSVLASAVNPRTAIGQRSDGAVLMLVIDGRQVTSLGATYGDLADIMLKYGAVNACNLDGGSSTLMWWQGKYINSSSSLVGLRYIPTAFVVLKEGQNG